MFATYSKILDILTPNIVLLPKRGNENNKFSQMGTGPTTVALTVKRFASEP